MVRSGRHPVRLILLASPPVFRVCPPVGRRTREPWAVDSGVTAILRRIPEDDVVAVAQATCEGGVRAIEITADTGRCSELVAAVDRELADTDAVIGAGTVTHVAAARNVIDPGAVAVGAGSSLVDHDAVEAGNWDQLKSSAAEFVIAVDSGRS